jgi:hypothetical protein
MTLIFPRPFTTSTVHAITLQGKLLAHPTSMPSPLPLGSVWLLAIQLFGNPTPTVFMCNPRVCLIADAGIEPSRTFNASSLAQQAIQHVCLTTSGNAPNYNSLPTQPCDRMRAETYFPSCWDGVNLDSASHSSHVGYHSSVLCLPTNHSFTGRLPSG